MADVPRPKFPMCVVTDGRCALAGCVLADVSRVLGPMADVSWPKFLVCVLAIRPTCLGRSFPCAW